MEEEGDHRRRSIQVSVEREVVQRRGKQRSSCSGKQAMTS